MKKILLPILSIIVCLAVFSRCSVDDDFLNSKKADKANFPEHIEKYGKTFAKELRQTIKSLNEKGVDYSNANNTSEFKTRFYKDWYNASPALTRSGVSIDQIGISPEKFAEGYRNLTAIQIEFIQRIINEGQKASSYDELFKILISINEDIYTKVPKIEQDRLLYTTAVLYYGLSEIQNLEKQGQMILTPNNNLGLSLVKTRSESGGIGGWCKKFLATTWAIAVGEPTPAGEIVAAVATIIVGGILLYEVITCTNNSSSVNCSAKYSDCVNSGSMPSWKCYDCFRYCEGQNVWDCPRPY